MYFSIQINFLCNSIFVKGIAFTLDNCLCNVSVLPDGSVSHSEIKAFMKKQNLVISTYKTITTSCNKDISLSLDHLIYGRQNDDEKFHPM